MFITIYKKTKNDQLYLIKFELINNKYRKWRGPEQRLLKTTKWKEYTSTNTQTGKARAAYAMFQEINRLVEKGYAIYKKKSKKIKPIKPIIRIRKFNLNKIKKLYDEGHKLYFTDYIGILAVEKTDGWTYDNFSRKKLYSFPFHKPPTRQFGSFQKPKKGPVSVIFIAFDWGAPKTPKELEIWLKFNKTKNLKTIVKINNTFYG